MKSIIVTAIGTAGLCLVAAVGAGAASGGKPAPMTAEAEVHAVCQKCHSATGDSVLPIFPRLNAQQPDYIVAQLKAFSSHKRNDTHAIGYMGPVAHQMDERLMIGLAKYFAAQKPTLPETGGALSAEGQKIYMDGIPAKGVAACQLCHGKAGEGGAAGPRIAGQHSAYLWTVMGAFKSGLRNSDAMHAVTKNMTDRDIAAVMSYLSND